MVEVQFPTLPSHPPTDSETTTTTETPSASDDNMGGMSSDDQAVPPKKFPPQGMHHHHKPSPQGCTSHDDDEMVIDDIDFSQSDAGIDSAEQIRNALARLVATVKRRKERSSSSKGNVGKRQDQNCEATAMEGKRKPSLKQKPIQVIMGWMDSFQDDEKIQLICLQALPVILEDPPSRLAAQADGLASIVLYNMAACPDHSLLQLTAFHTLVVLLRPLGTNEGMVHKAVAHRGNATNQSDKCIRSMKKHSSARHHEKESINAHPLLDASCEPRWEENGVRVMLDSLRRFSSDRYLQAMGCWAMVNAALYPSLKTSLLRLGGVYAVTNAMMLHPNVEAVQFRGLFALINLVIPDSKGKKDGDGSSLRAHVYQIARLTIVAMRNFHSNKSILNRGCLVLRNLSLTPEYVRILARTPGCVDMLLHCRRQCPRDALVQRSARTIMILVQRATVEGKDHGSKRKIGGGDAWSVTQPHSVGGRVTSSAASAEASFKSNNTHP